MTYPQRPNTQLSHFPDEQPLHSVSHHLPSHPLLSLSPFFSYILLFLHPLLDPTNHFAKLHHRQPG